MVIKDFFYARLNFKNKAQCNPCYDTLHDLLSNQNDVSVNLIMSLHLIVLYSEQLSLGRFQKVLI